MRKLAYGDNVVYVGLSAAEFKGLAGQGYSDVPDGTEISLLPIKQKVDLIDSKGADLTDLKTLSEQVVNKITAIGL